jgi:hypothetical protein
MLELLGKNYINTLSNGYFMKRGYLLLVFLSCTIILFTGIDFARAQLVPADCTIQSAACGGLFNAIGKVSSDGHFNSSLAGGEANFLCCKYLNTAAGGHLLFNVSGDGHVSINSSATTFTNAVKIDFVTADVELDSCYLKDDCTLPTEVCIFNVANATRTTVDNSHVAACSSSDLSAQVCCKYKEKNCQNGIDDDGDGYTDCADSDCQMSDNHPDPFVCTGSPYDEESCVLSFTRDTYAGTYVINFNPLCRGSNGNYSYCAYSIDNPGTGVCCPEGQKAKRNNFGVWKCEDSANCGLRSSNPTYSCDYDFDNAKPSWVSNVYAGVPANPWCVTTVSNLYDPDNLTSPKSTGCCLMAQKVKVDYYTAEGNIKIFGMT